MNLIWTRCSILMEWSPKPQLRNDLWHEMFHFYGVKPQIKASLGAGGVCSSELQSCSDNFSSSLGTCWWSCCVQSQPKPSAAGPGLAGLSAGLSAGFSAGFSAQGSVQVSVQGSVQGLVQVSVQNSVQVSVQGSVLQVRLCPSTPCMLRAECSPWIFPAQCQPEPQTHQENPDCSSPSLLF